MSLNIANNEPVFSISTAAKLMGISVHTLRMYEKEGLILPYKKQTSHRLYSHADVERIQCIRNAINEDKISINGIKTIYSLIPCWKITACGETAQTCKVFENHSVPCWLYKHRKNECTLKDCRTCVVYTDFGTCKSIKNKLTVLLTQQI